MNTLLLDLLVTIFNVSCQQYFSSNFNRKQIPCFVQDRVELKPWKDCRMTQHRININIVSSNSLKGRKPLECISEVVEVEFHKFKNI